MKLVNTSIFLVSICRELGIGIVPYSPLGRGFFTGKTDYEAPGDFRSAHPRFQGENKEANLKLFRTLKEIADKKGVSPGQLALAWVQNQGDDVAPIPGTTVSFLVSIRQRSPIFYVDKSFLERSDLTAGAD